MQIIDAVASIICMEFLKATRDLVLKYVWEDDEKAGQVSLSGFFDS